MTKKRSKRAARSTASRGVMGRMYGKTSRENPSDAIRRYKIFHKKEPRGIVKIQGLPSGFNPLGSCISVMYETDKWKPDGNDERYKHLHDEGVIAYEVADDGMGYLENLPVDLPSSRDGFARLGRCLGFFVKTDSGQVREYNPPDSDLFASPTGNLLGVYHPEKGWLAFICGGDLRVEAGGIDG